MSFSRVKPSGWAFGEILTSAQMNLLDTDHSVSAKSTHVPAENTLAGVQIPLTIGKEDTSTSPSSWTMKWNFGGSDTVNFWVETNKASGARVSFSLDVLLPDNVTVTQVEVVVNGNYAGGAAHTSISTSFTPPQVTFRELSTTGTVAYTVTQADTSASVGAYEITHPIDLVVSRTVSHLHRYDILFEGEQGANALNNYLAILSMSVSWTAAP